MIKCFLVTGLKGKKKRLKKALEILGDDNWHDLQIDNMGGDFIYCCIDDFTYYWGYEKDSIISLNDGLIEITYKELKALDKAFKIEMQKAKEEKALEYPEPKVFKRISFAELLAICVVEGKVVRTKKYDYYVQDGKIFKKRYGLYLEAEEIKVTDSRVLSKEIEILDE